jgi:hypothetical protein
MASPSRPATAGAFQSQAFRACPVLPVRLQRGRLLPTRQASMRRAIPRPTHCGWLKMSDRYLDGNRQKRIAIGYTIENYH